MLAKVNQLAMKMQQRNILNTHAHTKKENINKKDTV